MIAELPGSFTQATGAAYPASERAESLSITLTPKQRRITRRWLPTLMGLLSFTLLGGMGTAQAGIDIRAPFTHVGVDRERGVNVDQN